MTELLDLSGPQPLDPQASWLVILIQSGLSRLALIVERLLDEGDFLILPLPPAMRGQPLVAGLVVLGDESLVSMLKAQTLIERAHRLQGAQPRAGAKEQGLSVPHILVVDDSSNTREIEREILESQGWRVTVAADRLKGWQKPLVDCFDAVVTDLDMPGLDGFSLTECLRAHERYRHTPSSWSPPIKTMLTSSAASRSAPMPISSRATSISRA
ncbi:response regulator [Caldichromatium japonicum]|uniref:response regulator n=1 Tax=Caldichromatium japonicum TaxID=2699430 RepID=UPI001FE95FE5|nr:response regulator [Caldichromatium japonicum]